MSQITLKYKRLHNITFAAHFEPCINTLITNSLIDVTDAQFGIRFNIFPADFGHIYSS